jgi:non-specific serine/threonine protein kinase
MELARQLGYVHVLAANLHVLASTAGSQGQPVRSTRLWGAAEALRESIGVALSPVELYHYGPYITAARAQLDEAAWEAAWAEGKAMTTEETIEYALYEEESEEPPTGKAAVKLTPREREVAGLLARGLTNHQIAAKLTLSKRTVDNHVANILKKLNLSSRSEVGARIERSGGRADQCHLREFLSSWSASE